MKRKQQVALFAGPIGQFSEGKDPPREFLVLRAGANQTTKGPFLFDDAAAQAVMTAYASRGLDKIQIDYEHQSTQAPPAGGDAAKPAAGWFKPEVRNGDLWAVELSWTSKAAAMLAPPEGAPEYRYFSPILFFDQETRRVTGLKNIALTNDPAMDGLQPLMAASAIPNDKETEMPCEACTALSTKLTAMEKDNKDLSEKCSTLSARLSAFEKTDKDKTEAMTALTASSTETKSKLIALTGQQGEAAALGVIEAWKKDAADTSALRTKLAQIETAQLEAQLTALVDKAAEEGKVEPAKKDAFAAMAKDASGKVTEDGIAKLTAFVGALSPKVSTKETKAKESGEVELTSDDIRACELSGTDPAEFKAYKAALLKQSTQRAGA